MRERIAARPHNHTNLRIRALFIHVVKAFSGVQETLGKARDGDHKSSGPVVFIRKNRFDV